MRGFPPIAAQETFRVRRWDAVVVGGALPGLIAAVRLGMRGARVLVVEEDAAAGAFPGLREPFLMTDNGGDGVFGGCLHALGIPLIDRRRMESEPLAYQVAFPDARVDIGEPDWTAEELESWGLALGGVARKVVASLAEDAAAQANALLAARIVQPTRRLPLRARRVRGSAGRSAPRETANARSGAWATTGSAELERLFDAQLRGLSSFAASPPTSATRARLLGAALGGAAQLGGHRWLRNLLQQRIEALYGEFRVIREDFRFVSAGRLPALALEENGDVLAGRALLINAPLSSLRSAIPAPIPDLLEGPNATHRRLFVHQRGCRRMLPEGMAPRVICVRDPAARMAGTNVVNLRIFANPCDAEQVDLVASAVVPIDGSEPADLEAELASAVARLMPLARESWVRVPRREPIWDREGELGDPAPESGWLGDGSFRPSSRIPVYVLDRWRLGALGFEGDLLLGWRAGDAVATDLG